MVRALQIAVVAAIVLIVLSFYLPRRGYQRSNDSAAIANLRTINTAELTYKVYLPSSDGTYGSMTDLIAAGLLDDGFTAIKSGYKYSLTLDETSSVYTAEATPASAKTGRYGYYTVPDGVVRYSTNASLAPARKSGRYVQ